MTKIEIIDETVKFYGEDFKRRAVEDGSCLYTTADGRNCAVGRCLLGKYKKVSMPWNKGLSPINVADCIGMEDMDSLLLKKYRGHDTEFWGEIQSFHDDSRNWSEKGLTSQGQVVELRLKEHFKE